jgi:hypothetical protein
VALLAGSIGILFVLMSLGCITLGASRPSALLNREVMTAVALGATGYWLALWVFVFNHPLVAEVTLNLAALAEVVSVVALVRQPAAARRPHHQAAIARLPTAAEWRATPWRAYLRLARGLPFSVSLLISGRADAPR